MPYHVELRPPAQSALDRLPLEVQGRIITKAMTLAENPRPQGVKKLQGQIGLYRVRVGSFRIVYRIDDPRRVVTITIIADRKDSYRGL